MTGINKGKGSFKGLRARELLLFDPALHRHDRGWPHPPPKQPAETQPRNRWKTVGIFHFPQHDEHDNEGDTRNGGAC